MKKQDVPNPQYGDWYGIVSQRDELDQFSLDPPIVFAMGRSLTYGEAKRVCDIEVLNDQFPQPTDGNRQYSDDEDLMPIWENLHYEEMASIVRRLAVSCPHLEEFVLDCDFPPMRRRHFRVPDEYDQVGPRWKWRILRELGTDSIKDVSGELFWNGCGRGDPIQREILVGQELAYRDFLAQEEALKDDDRRRNELMSNSG